MCSIQSYQRMCNFAMENIAQNIELSTRYAMFLFLGGLFGGLFVAAFFIIMTFLIIYFMNKNKAPAKESFSELYPVTTTNMPLRFRGCSSRDYGTLRCAIA